MAELMFGLGQTRKKKESDAKIKFTRDRLRNVTITETAESIVRSGQHDRDQRYKGTQRETRKNLKNVTQEETGEMAIRKQQSDREKQWKQTGRNQVKTNSKFDMARSLFGGASPVAITRRDEERSFDEEHTVTSLTEYSDDYVDGEMSITIDENSEFRK
jgi:DNA repair exonuclease SbcCD ATPase subunit